MSLKHQEQEIRRYLLRDPSQSEEEKTAIEQSYLRDEAAHQELLETEDELVDAYVFGRLDSNETALFKKSLGDSPRWRAKVELATSLWQYASRSREAVAGEETTWWRNLLVAGPGYRLVVTCVGCALVVVSALSFYYLHTHLINRPAPTVARARTPSSQGITSTVPLPPTVEPQKPPAPKVFRTTVLSFILTPDLVRGNGEQALVKIPRGHYDVRLRMQRDNETYVRYEATVFTPEQEHHIVAHRTNLRPVGSGNTRTVVLTVRSEFLPPGVYIMNLKGKSAGSQFEDLDDYTFQVARQ